jgi:hypothetical protein
MQNVSERLSGSAYRRNDHFTEYDTQYRSCGGQSNAGLVQNDEAALVRPKPREAATPFPLGHSALWRYIASSAKPSRPDMSGFPG